MQNTEKDMIFYIKKKFLSLINIWKKDQLKQTEFSWNIEDNMAMYLMKLHKDQERLKKSHQLGQLAKGNKYSRIYVLKLTVWQGGYYQLGGQRGYGTDVPDMQVIFQGALRE